jgi:two-component system, LytTR family, response regulator
MPYRALLLDDERLARKQLRALLAGFEEIEVVAEAASVPEGLRAVEAHRPDVVFLDIQMPAETGFDFLQKVQVPFTTIFVTAHDRFAVRAFEVNGLDYLLKPVESERLAQAIGRLSLRREIPCAATPFETSDYLFVSSGSSARFIQISRIQYVSAAGPYSEIFTDDGNKWMLLRSMKEWQRRLPAAQFVRIHRSTLVNLDFVESIEPLANYSYRIVLKGSQRRLAMSRRHALLLKGRLA